MIETPNWEKIFATYITRKLISKRIQRANNLKFKNIYTIKDTQLRGKNGNKNFTEEEALVDSKPVTRGLALLAQS